MDKTLITEMSAAARGTLALLRGRRNASDYFDLGTRGLIGSLIAFVFAAGFNALLPGFLGATGEGPLPWQSLIMVAVLYILQIGFGALALMQFGRLDGLVPYLVASNWVTFFATLLSGLLTISGLSVDVALLILVVLVLVIEINIARLIVTLKISQIAMFLIAQLVGGMVGLMLIGTVFPMDIAG